MGKRSRRKPVPREEDEDELPMLDGEVIAFDRRPAARHASPLRVCSRGQRPIQFDVFDQDGQLVGTSRNEIQAIWSAVTAAEELSKLGRHGAGGDGARIRRRRTIRGPATPLERIVFCVESLTCHPGQATAPASRQALFQLPADDRHHRFARTELHPPL